MHSYFSHGSLLRQVHGERVVGLLYGSRALCVGAANPLTYVATAIHSANLQAPFGRLARTAQMIEAIILGSREEADRLLIRVRAVHEQVIGRLPVDAGRYPAGTRYSALDSELMLWTLAVIADSTRYFFELFVHPLTDRDKETLWQDYLRLGELFGMPRAAAPTTYAQFRKWWHTYLDSRLCLTDEAYHAGHATAFQLPLPHYASSLQQIYRVIVLGSLPRQVRDLYGLRYTGKDEAKFARTVKVIRFSRKVTHSRLARGRNDPIFRWIAQTERLRIEHNKPTPHFASPVTSRDTLGCRRNWARCGPE
jgi:uncharacterized protein (DUF2236 family)